VLSLIVAGDAEGWTPEQQEKEYVKRGHTFLVKEYVRNIPGWARLMKQRFRQIQSLEERQQKWNGYIQTMLLL
jgi:hypothetical protein